MPKTTMKKGDECGEGDCTKTSLIVGRREKVESDVEERGVSNDKVTKRGCDQAASKGNGGGIKGRGESIGRDQGG